ncbi:hypothetical protein GCM10010919_03460 [Alishewanella longhuensis]|uniref:DUF4386 domain-containing protein n=1 Tax=Alishewanella longhuensis TaxID=1091037 RepID=A0ABQ3KXY0_9ALTE|nr:hypothetical protein [Alishewanella longhuensis]GHG60204.1 hypothetical protein GCM10010919_03460 [Alishewanella longhuensis]
MRDKTIASPAILQAGGVAAFGMAFCYISVAVIFFGLITLPPDLDSLGRLQYFLQQQYLWGAIGYGIGYLVFGVLLAILLQALRQAIAEPQSALAGLAERFGNVWLVLMMASGMVALLSMEMTLRLLDTNTEQALALHNTYQLLTNALGGGIELVGGLWALLLSMAGLKHNVFSKSLYSLGIIVGSLGIATVLHTLPYLKDAFGITQFIWFIWLGVTLLRLAREL